MISAALSKELTDQQIVVETAYNDFYTTVANRDKWQAAIDELDRQIQYHVSHGDPTNANIVSVQLSQTKGYLDAAKTAYNAALALYKTELAEYKQIKNKLSPVDRIEQDKADASNEALNNTGNVNSVPAPTAMPQPGAATQNYAQDDTKYYIGGGIILTILVFVFFFFRNRKTKAV